jgi:hypothetical protein
MFIEKRSLPLAIIFAVITCGIYMIYWEYRILDSLYRVNNMPSSAGTDVLLSILTCGIYGLYMLYRAGKMESSAMAMYNFPEKDEGALYVILGIFSMGIVSFCILQSNINTMLADAHNNTVTYDDPQRRQY